jgi:hypothetical protein
MSEAVFWPVMAFGTAEVIAAQLPGPLARTADYWQ